MCQYTANKEKNPSCSMYLIKFVVTSPYTVLLYSANKQTNPVYSIYVATSPYVINVYSKCTGQILSTTNPAEN